MLIYGWAKLLVSNRALVMDLLMSCQSVVERDALTGTTRPQTGCAPPIVQRDRALCDQGRTLGVEQQVVRFRLSLLEVAPCSAKTVRERLERRNDVVRARRARW
jgi:hypothetical protein